jgi:serine/threonine protein kinase
VIGRTINNYEVRALIAEGGQGAIYLAEHPFLKRRAAIKCLRGSLADDPNVVARFMNEARAASEIHHPNIIDVIDVGRLPDGPPYLMMELLEGESLGDRLRRQGRLPIADALAITREVADALAAAHARGIVHRDLKPDNLFLARDGSSWRNERTKVLDFGIAKLNARHTGVSPQTGGMAEGTPAYMAPEECRADGGEVDHRADIYALGTVLYHMLCGAPPFVDQAQLEVCVMHVTQPPVPPRQHNPEIPPSVEAAILRALAKEPGDRFASMAEFREAVTPVGGLTPTVLLPRVIIKRNRWLARASVAAVVLLAGALAWTFRPHQRRTRPVATAAAPTMKKVRPPRRAAWTAAAGRPPAPVVAAAVRQERGRADGPRAPSAAPAPARGGSRTPSASRRQRGTRRSASVAGATEQDGRRTRKWIDKW